MFSPLSPLPIAAEAADLFSREQDIAMGAPVDRAIPVLLAPNITREISENGWSPDLVTIHSCGAFPGEQISPGIVAKRGHYTDNDTKYALVSLPQQFSDPSNRLELYVEETDYNTVTGAASFLQDNKDKVLKYVSCDPKRKRVPNSLCLHAVCEFSDGSLQALKRTSDTPYSPNDFSLSFEEQLDEVDFQSGAALAATTWMHRAVCEELFPLLNKRSNKSRISLSQAYNSVAQYIDYMRFWALLLEVEIGNFALMGHIKVNIDPIRFAEIYRDFRATGHMRDKEGLMYNVSRNDVRELLQSRPAQAREMNVDDNTKEILGDFVPIGTLHRTTLCRALLWGKCSGLI